jgi:hypothetical protein
MSIVGQLLLGWLLADFLTGVFHWWEDRLGKESWPVIGHLIIKPIVCTIAIRWHSREERRSWIAMVQASSRRW